MEVIIKFKFDLPGVCSKQDFGEQVHVDAPLAASGLTIHL